MLLPAALAIASVPAARLAIPGKALAAPVALDATSGSVDSKGPVPAPISPPAAGSGPTAAPEAADSDQSSAPQTDATQSANGTKGSSGSTSSSKKKHSLDNEIIVTGNFNKPPPGDPLEHANEVSFHVIEGVDKALIQPLALGYEHGVPKPVRNGLRNFIRNLHEPVVFVAFLLEGKPGKAVETLGRFAINSTIGIAGFIDVAKRKPFDLPYYRNGFADLMGYYGIGPGPFLMLPLLGPTTVRDLIGSGLDIAALPPLPFAFAKTPEYKIGLYTIRSLNERLDSQARLRRIRQSVNPYATLRQTYLCQRRRQIAGLHNRPPPDCMPVPTQGLGIGISKLAKPVGEVSTSKADTSDKTGTAGKKPSANGKTDVPATLGKQPHG